MSEYGPALFVSRADGAELPQAEQAIVVELVSAACRALKLTDDDGDPVAPEVYDYSGYEPGALGILLYTSFVYDLMDADAQAGEEAGWKAQGFQVAAEVERQALGIYKFACYGVES